MNSTILNQKQKQKQNKKKCKQGIWKVIVQIVSQNLKRCK